MTEPLEILKHEHRIIEQGLRVLDGICRRLEGGEQVPPETLSQLLDFIRRFADRCHNMKEEFHLFPALQQHGVPRQGGCIGVLLHEHELGRSLVAQLDRAIQAYQNKRDPASRSFVDSARSYIDLLNRHIEKEDNILFRIAEQVLDDRERASLSQDFERTEIGLGLGAHEQYEQMVAALEKAWAS